MARSSRPSSGPLLNTTFIQINTARADYASGKVLTSDAGRSADIIFIQEPYYRKSAVGYEVVGWTGMRVVPSLTVKEPRACIAVANKDLEATYLSHLSNEFITTVNIKGRGLDFIACSVYVPLHPHDPSDTFAFLTDIISRREDRQILLLGDFNCRSHAFGDFEENSRGVECLTFIDSNRLMLINDPESEPTFCRRSRTAGSWAETESKSWIDLTLCSTGLFHHITSWDVDDEEIVDHRMLVTTFSSARSYVTPEKRHFACKKADWDKFRRIIDENRPSLIPLADIRSRNSVETAASTLQSLLFSAADQSIPRCRNFPRTTHWWNEDIAAARKVMLRLKRIKKRRSADNEAIKAFYDAKKAYNLMVKDAKERTWMEFCTVEPNKNPWGVVYKLCAGKLRKTREITAVRRPDGTMTESAEESADVLMDAYFPDDDESQDSAGHRQVRLAALQDSVGNNDVDFTFDEVKSIVASLNPKKAPGIDLLSAEIIKEAFDALGPYITGLFNACLRLQTFPKEWKTSLLRIIPKGDKTDTTASGSARPICLIPLLAKVLDKLMINRIMYFLHKTGYLSHNQYGFTPQKSTEDAVERLMSIINKIQEPEFTCPVSNIKYRKGVSLYSLDISGAFNSSWWPKIISELIAAKTPNNLVGLVKHYFQEREVVYEGKTFTKRRILTRGCPQGSCSGPGFWIVLFNVLLREEFGPDVYLVGYADDVVLVIGGRWMNSDRRRGQVGRGEIAERVLRRIDEVGISVYLKFNSAKTQRMEIAALNNNGTRKNLGRPNNVTMNGEVVKVVSTMKYLGIMIDDRLNWGPHIKYVKQKVRQFQRRLMTVAKANYGMSPTIVRQIYEGAIEPACTYLASVWGHRATNVKEQDRLESIQRPSLLAMTRGYRTISNEALPVIAACLPLHLRVRQIHEIRQKKKAADVESRLPYLEEGHPAEQFGLTAVSEAASDGIHIYTDGSKMDSGVGSGFHAVHGESVIHEASYRLGPRCSVFQAELLAIERALDWSMSQQDTPVTILTDSQASLMALQSRTSGHRLVHAIKTLTKAHQTCGRQVLITWVRAHIGTPGNEAADRLAKAGSESTTLTETYSLIPMAEVKLEAKRKYLQIWQEEWSSPKWYRDREGQQHQNGRQTFPFLPSIRERMRNRSFIPDHYLTMLLSGHGNCRHYFWNRLKTAARPECECGATEQTVRHLILDCQRFADIRRSILGLDVPTVPKMIDCDTRDKITKLCRSIMNACGYKEARRPAGRTARIPTTATPTESANTPPEGTPPESTPPESRHPES